VFNNSSNSCKENDYVQDKAFRIPMPLNILNFEQKHLMTIPSLFCKIWLFLLKSFICGCFQNLVSYMQNYPLKQLRPIEYMLVLPKFVASSIYQALDQVTVAQLVINFPTFY